MHNLNKKNNKKNKSMVTTTATGATAATVMAFLTFAAPMLLLLSSLPQSAQAFHIEFGPAGRETQAPSVVSGDNIYIAWWTNNTENGNEEVMFRASTDGGATFSDRINLSNTTDADSWRVEIAGEGDTVVVSWWETNQTSDIPVARISTDAGETFGELIMLGTNGTIGVTEEEGEEGAAVAAEGGEEGGEEEGGEEEAAAANGGE